MKTFIVKKQTELTEYLIEVLLDWPKKKIKQYLSHRSVLVNGKERTKYNYPLKAGNVVSVLSEKEATGKQLLAKSFIYPVYEDNDLIVVNKPPGLLTIANESTNTDTLYYKVTDYVRIVSGAKGARIFIVHRLDKDASGFIVFAKNEKSKNDLQGHWDMAGKKYYAVVEGCPKEKSGEIRSCLAESDSFRVHSVRRKNQGKLAITKYKVVKIIPGYSLCEVTLITGRKNQIRVHLSEMGCPIIGDKKYGAKTNPVKQLGLHAYYLSFVHPATKMKMTFQTELPGKLKYFINSSKKP